MKTATLQPSSSVGIPSIIKNPNFSAQVSDIVGQATPDEHNNGKARNGQTSDLGVYPHNGLIQEPSSPTGLKLDGNTLGS